MGVGWFIRVSMCVVRKAIFLRPGEEKCFIFYSFFFSWVGICFYRFLRLNMDIFFLTTSQSKCGLCFDPPASALNTDIFLPTIGHQWNVNGTLTNTVVSKVNRSFMPKRSGAGEPQRSSFEFLCFSIFFFFLLSCDPTGLAEIFDAQHPLPLRPAGYRRPPPRPPHGRYMPSVVLALPQVVSTRATVGLCSSSGPSIAL